MLESQASSCDDAEKMLTKAKAYSQIPGLFYHLDEQIESKGQSFDTWKWAYNKPYFGYDSLEHLALLDPALSTSRPRYLESEPNINTEGFLTKGISCKSWHILFLII